MKINIRKILALFMSLLMLISVMSGLTFTSFADNSGADAVFEYAENDDGTLTITDFTAGEDSTGNLDIPSKIDGRTVTGIEDYVLYGDYESVTIPETVTSGLYSYTFKNLDKLKVINVSEDNPEYSSVDGILLSKDKSILYAYPKNKSNSFTVPSSVNLINESAFCYNDNISDIIIPDTVTEIGYKAFCGCSNLSQITISNNVESIGYDAFYGTAYWEDESNWEDGYLYLNNYLLKYYGESESVSIKDSTVLIADDAFYYNEKIKEVNIPDSVKYIGSYAFSGCSSLETVNIPDSVSNINNRAFYRCPNLTSITIPKNVIEIGYHAFGYTDAYDEDGYLYEIKTDGFTIYGYTNTAAGRYARECGFTFVNLDSDGTSEIFGYTENDDGTIYITDFYPADDSTGNLEIPSKINGRTVTGIEDYVLYGDYESVTIPETVTGWLSSSTFYELTKLKAINVSENNPAYSSVDGILLSKDKTYLRCCPQGKTGTFTIPDSVEDIIYGSAFLNCNSITEIVIPSSFSYNDNLGYDFSKCGGLEKITADENNEYYSSVDGILYSKDKSILYAYPQNKSGSFTVPSYVNFIGLYAFSYNDNISDIVIPDTVTEIRYGAFCGCSNLSQITISNNVESIGSYAFYDTAYWEDESNWEDGYLYLNNYLLKYYGESESVSIKDSAVLIADYAFWYNEKIKEVSIPDSVKYIGSSAFSDCSSLETVNIPDSVSNINNRAFYRCPNLTSITIPKNVIEIGYNAFGYTDAYDEDNGYWYEIKTDGFTIYGYAGTAAEEYANENEFTFVNLDSTECEHKNTAVKNAVSATCTTDGYTGDTYCNDCGQTIVYGNTITALGHTSEVIKGKSAACTEKGLTDGEKCSVCGAVIKEQKEIPALGHKAEAVKGKSASCTEKGLTDGEKCSVCGAVIKEQTEIPALGHKAEAVKGKSATCTEKGLTDGEKCSVCGTVIKEQKEIPALGHKAEAVKGKSATCTEKGLTDGEKCSVCGAVIKEQKEIPALGHKFEKGVCTVCGAMDPDCKLVLNTDSKLLLDLDKKSVTNMPVSVNGTTASEFKKQFENEIDLGLDDGALIANGTKFTFNGTEYTIIVKGDAQPDGKITASDARTILRIAAKLDNPDDITKSASDINSDGKVTTAEARNILRFAARLSSSIEG